MDTEAMKQDFRNVWSDRKVYDDAERIYYEKLAKLTAETVPKQQSLADEVAKARQHIKSSLENVGQAVSCSKKSINNESDEVQKQFAIFQDKIDATTRELMSSINSLTARVEALEIACVSCTKPALAICPQAPVDYKKPKQKEDDDVDLFASDSEGEDEAAKKIKEQRLAEYQSKKAKKPVLVAKSNIILDVKPWDDETDMKLLEKAVREIQMDGLVWGASKLVPLAYGIFKLQISCVVEDEKVSVDLLQEMIEGIEDFVQSVDIAAFNKV